jgi:CBS-domain-containing membrane protein
VPSARSAEENIMNASDIMVRKVITTDPQASVSRVAKQLADNDISALPVVDDAGRVVGIISEADAQYQGANLRSGLRLPSRLMASAALAA